MTTKIDLGTAISLAMNILSLIFAGTQVLFSWQCMVALKSVYDTETRRVERRNSIKKEHYDGEVRLHWKRCPANVADMSGLTEGSYRYGGLFVKVVLATGSRVTKSCESRSLFRLLSVDHV